MYELHPGHSTALRPYLWQEEHAVYFSLLARCALTHTHACTHTCTLSLVWSELSGSAAGQPVPLHISVIHPCHSGQDHEGGVECWMEGRKRPTWLAFNPPSPPPLVALCSPVASSRNTNPTPPLPSHFFPPLPPQPPEHQSLLLQHGSMLKRTHGKGQRGQKIAWTQLDLARGKKKRKEVRRDMKRTYAKTFNSTDAESF